MIGRICQTTVVVLAATAIMLGAAGCATVSKTACAADEVLAKTDAVVADTIESGADVAFVPVRLVQRAVDKDTYRKVVYLDEPTPAGQVEPMRCCCCQVKPYRPCASCTKACEQCEHAESCKHCRHAE